MAFFAFRNICLHLPNAESFHVPAPKTEMFEKPIVRRAFFVVLKNNHYFVRKAQNNVYICFNIKTF